MTAEAPSAQPARSSSSGLRHHIGSTADEALGRKDRHHPVHPTRGGVAGNALLTAWTGLIILALSLAQLLTLFDVTGLISWHVAIGALLTPVAVAKTATTGWRLMRYYSHHDAYAESGPPPLLLRILGPVVVASTLSLLASGIWLIIDGQSSAKQPIVTLLGSQIDWVSVHAAIFWVWIVAASLHLIARLVPALRIVTGRHAPEVDSVPARALRLLWFAAMTGASAALAVVLVGMDSSWQR